MRRIKNCLFVLAAVFAFAGCNTLSDGDARNDLAAELTVKYAVMKVVERSGDPSAKAARIADIAGQARALIDTGAVALVLELEAIIRARIPWSDLDAADTLLADALLTTVRMELLSRVDAGSIDDTTRVAVTKVLDSIIESAALFAGPTG